MLQEHTRSEEVQFSNLKQRSWGLADIHSCHLQMSVKVATPLTLANSWISCLKKKQKKKHRKSFSYQGVNELLML